MPFLAFYKVFGFSVDQGTGALTQLWEIHPTGQFNSGPIEVFNIPNLVPVQTDPNAGSAVPWGLNPETDPIYEDIYTLLNTITTAQTGVEGVADAFAFMGDLRGQYPLQWFVNGAFVGVRDTVNVVPGAGMTISGTDDGVQVKLTVTGTGNQFSATNQSGGTISAGQPVSRTSTGVVLASASNTTKPCRGLAMGGVAAGLNGNFQSSGILSLTDWTAATGGVNLVQGSYYYLSTTAGKLTATKPSTGPCQMVGQANSATDLDVQIREFLGL